METREEDIVRSKKLITVNVDRLQQEKDVIRKYGALFNPAAIDELTKEKFQEFLLMRNNHHWDGIHRQQKFLTEDMEKLKTALKILLDESTPLEDRLNTLFPPTGQHYIKGLGKAIVTPVLLVSHPDKYGVWNAKSEQGLTKLGLIQKFKSSQSFAERYLEVNKHLLDLAQKYEVTLWQLDEIIGWILHGNYPISVDDISGPRNRDVQHEDAPNISPSRFINTPMMSPKTTGPKMIKPSAEEVEYYLKKWESLESYSLQESSLTKLFTKTYPLNVDLDDVLIKVCSLNDFYSTNIFSPFTVAKHIVDLKIDDNLAQGDLSIVNKIASVGMNGGNIINFYSFATKYCSHHKPTIYPIYDSYVDKMLRYCKRVDGFDSFEYEGLKSYEKFKQVLNNFRSYYQLESYDLKQIDKYLWLAGKNYFPKNYGNKA